MFGLLFELLIFMIERFPTFFISAPFGNYISHKHAISVHGTYTLRPRGNRIFAIAKSLRYNRELGGWTNKLGLPNPGLEVGLDKIHPDQVLSIAEIERGDFLEMRKIIPHEQSIELNLSCPNLGKTLPWDDTKHLVNSDREWCIAKVSPLTTPEHLEYLIDIIGFRTIHFSNTLPVRQGGLSGPELIPYTIELIKTVRENWKNDDIEIVAGGGVRDHQTVYDYLQAGANHISIGTLCFSPIKLWKLLNT